MKKIGSAIATGALLLNAFAPFAFADTTITVTGNGSSSDNTANVTQTNTTTVNQTNNATVTNNVTSNANTGGNKANDNTGGDVTVKTGDATNTTNVSTSVNANSANVDNCNCGGDTTVTISGNGTESDNSVDLGSSRRQSSNSTTVNQLNNATVNNNVDAKAKTGDNKADGNTNGDVLIQTGDASSNATVSTTANVNSATVGGGNGGNGSVSLIISGNGSDSENEIKFKDSNSVEFNQTNNANISNHVDATAKTGDNKANDNTGGDVTVKTGNATSDANVSTLANFNAADTACGCDMTVKAKIEGNGTDSENEIKATLGNDLTVNNLNNLTLDNCIDANSKTGDNKANDNTGAVSSNDPFVQTGDATNSTTVNNSANVNAVNSVPVFPTLSSNVNFTANFAAVWAAWSAFISTI